MTGIQNPFQKKVLQVHSRGCELGKKFSAFFARINYEGRNQSIEEIYQKAKSFDGLRLDKKSAKGKQPTSFFVGEEEFNVALLTGFYYSLWMIYYLNNPDLVNRASNYDDFEDIFKGKSINCQEDTLRDWIKNRDRFYLITRPFLDEVKSRQKQN